MPVRVHARDQHGMGDRRRAVSSCYICGDPLDLLDSDGKPLDCINEHVIPLSLLSRVPVAEADRVPVILRVHKICEANHKHPNEQLSTLLWRFFALGERDLHKREAGVLRAHAKLVPRQGAEDGFANSQLTVPTGADDLLKIWARGLIAALYGRSLPQVVSMHANPPIPMVRLDKSERRGLTDLKQWSIVRDVIVSSVAVGRETGNFDELVAWGGAVRFYAVWEHRPEIEKHLPWTCYWALELPGYEVWSLQVLGYVNPYHGMVGTTAVPTGASILTPKVWERARAAHELRERYGLRRR